MSKFPLQNLTQANSGSVGLSGEITTNTINYEGGGTSSDEFAKLARENEAKASSLGYGVGRIFRSVWDAVYNATLGYPTETGADLESAIDSYKKKAKENPVLGGQIKSVFGNLKNLEESIAREGKNRNNYLSMFGSCHAQIGYLLKELGVDEPLWKSSLEKSLEYYEPLKDRPIPLLRANVFYNVGAVLSALDRNTEAKESFQEVISLNRNPQVLGEFNMKEVMENSIRAINQIDRGDSPNVLPFDLIDQRQPTTPKDATASQLTKEASKGR